jgi:hypothetical protein
MSVILLHKPDLKLGTFFNKICAAHEKFLIVKGLILNILI